MFVCLFVFFFLLTSLLPPHTIPLGRPSAPAPSIQHRALNLDCSPANFSIVFLLLLSCMSCLCILEFKPLSVTSFASVFSHSLGCPEVLIGERRSFPATLCLSPGFSGLFPHQVCSLNHHYFALETRTFQISTFDLFSVALSYSCHLL